VADIIHVLDQEKADQLSRLLGILAVNEQAARSHSRQPCALKKPG
jgi:hypothetical protein